MKRWLFLLAALSFGLSSLASEEFSFQYRKGEQYRIASIVNEDVLINGRYSHSAQILNRIAFEVTRTEGGRGFLEGTFQTSEKARAGGGIYEWAEEYPSRFWRDAKGRYEIEPEIKMPIVRNVPFFPDEELVPGATWSAPGYEVHDLSRAFGISEPLRYPVQVFYEYRGKTEYKGELYDQIDIRYAVFQYNQEIPLAAFDYPRRISGQSRQTLLWDNILGRPVLYEEEFQIFWDLAGGDTYEFRGTARAEVTAVKAMDRRRVADDVEQSLARDGVRDTVVSVEEEGVSISLRNIRFPPDSARLPAAERRKLDSIGAVLGRYPERDILVTGHTALAGSEAGRQRLSEERAAAVAAYLIAAGVRDAEQVVVRGMGGREPVADNLTEAGMKQNRRVEILILEN